LARLYDADVLDEEAVLAWFDAATDAGSSARERAAALGFLVDVRPPASAEAQAEVAAETGEVSEVNAADAISSAAATPLRALRPPAPAEDYSGREVIDERIIAAMRPFVEWLRAPGSDSEAPGAPAPAPAPMPAPASAPAPAEREPSSEADKKAEDADFAEGEESGAESRGASSEWTATVSTASTTALNRAAPAPPEEDASVSKDKGENDVELESDHTADSGDDETALTPRARSDAAAIAAEDCGDVALSRVPPGAASAAAFEAQPAASRRPSIASSAAAPASMATLQLPATADGKPPPHPASKAGLRAAREEARERRRNAASLDVAGARTKKRGANAAELSAA
jgi:hypothetical protein